MCLGGMIRVEETLPCSAHRLQKRMEAVLKVLERLVSTGREGEGVLGWVVARVRLGTGKAGWQVELRRAFFRPCAGDEHDRLTATVSTRVGNRGRTVVGVNASVKGGGGVAMNVCGRKGVNMAVSWCGELGLGAASR